MLKQLQEKIRQSPEFREITASGEKEFFFTGIRGSLTSFVITFLFESNRKIVFCSSDSARLFRLKDDLNLLIGEDKTSLYLGEFDEEFESDVTPLSGTLKKITGSESFVLVTSPAALDKNIITEESFRKNTISLKKDTEFSFEELVLKLREFNF
ncbi:MAG TPA: hypothetical protein VG961_05925, partial [Ignavibacteria bacterium]|nr:hypothetical protein [Ignavibacteria bacterium]